MKFTSYPASLTSSLRPSMASSPPEWQSALPARLAVLSIVRLVCGWSACSHWPRKLRKSRAISRLLHAERYCRITACSAVFLGLFLGLGRMDYRHAPASAWIGFALITLCGSSLGLANIGTSVAVERDWVTTISLQQDEATLTRLNTYMRRIDLICKLLAPLWTSLLTTAASYTFAVAFLMGFAALTLAFELWWIQVVFKKFPILAETDRPVKALTAGEAGQQTATPADAQSRPKHRILALYHDWAEFAKMPVFASSAAISLLYLTVLSFDGNMLAYLKSRNYSDAFVAGQRGVCVVTGLAGTVLMPWLERKVGLARAGAWSIVSVCRLAFLA